MSFSSYVHSSVAYTAYLPRSEKLIFLGVLQLDENNIHENLASKVRFTVWVGLYKILKFGSVL